MHSMLDANGSVQLDSPMSTQGPAPNNIFERVKAILEVDKTESGLHFQEVCSFAMLAMSVCSSLQPQQN